MEVWPNTLPQLMDYEGYQEGFGDGRVKSNMEGGTPKMRRRFSVTARPLSGSFTMSSDQLELFKTFITVTLLGGVKPFIISKQGGNAAGTWIVQFGDQMPSWVPYLPDSWRVNVQLVIMP